MDITMLIVFLDILMSTSSKNLFCGSPADRHLVHLRSPHRRLFVSWADDISSGNLLSVEDLATKKPPTRYHRVYHSYRYISYIQYHQISGSSIHLTAWNMGNFTHRVLGFFITKMGFLPRYWEIHKGFGIFLHHKYLDQWVVGSIGQWDIGMVLFFSAFFSVKIHGMSPSWPSNHHFPAFPTTISHVVCCVFPPCFWSFFFVFTFSQHFLCIFSSRRVFFPIGSQHCEELIQLATHLRSNRGFSLDLPGHRWAVCHRAGGRDLLFHDGDCNPWL